MNQDLNEFSFNFLQSSLECLSSAENRESLLKWNLDNDSLLINRYRYTGSLSSDMMDDYRRLLESFFLSDVGRTTNKIFNMPSYPINIKYTKLETNITSTSFFDRLEDYNIISSSGSIKGCYEEMFDGVTANDTLRELLLNEDSEHASAFNSADRHELIYQIFRILVIGGSMCQSEVVITRYLELTKDIYKDVLTAYKDSETGDIRISGKVMKIEIVDGMELFETNHEHVNIMIIIVDPTKKFVTTIKRTYKPFW